jgi:hypothetical protein
MVAKSAAWLCAVLTLTLSTLAAATAAPTPMPGGANQLKGVTGTLSSTIFNGKLRFKKFVLRTSTPAEATPDPGGMALTLTYIVSDGIPKNIYGNVSATIADVDGVTIPGHSVGVYGAYYSMPPGAAVRGTIYFTMPAGFTPVKILLTPGDGPAIRINLKPSDIPTPSPSPSPTPSS